MSGSHVRNRVGSPEKNSTQNRSHPADESQTRLNGRPETGRGKRRKNELICISDEDDDDIDLAKKIKSETRVTPTQLSQTNSASLFSNVCSVVRNSNSGSMFEIIKKETDSMSRDELAKLAR